MVLVYVALGGAAGSVLRYVLGGSVQRSLHAGFPYGTLFVNVAGCLLLGILISTFMNLEPPPYLRGLLVVGFCGGFTTFSAFSNETVGLLQAGAYARATTYVFLTLLLCLLATIAGMSAVRAIGFGVHGR